MLTGTARQSLPACSKVARASSHHEQKPPPATCSTPVSRRSAISTSAPARWPVKVGQPTWSSTTWTSSRSRARRSMVATKLAPWTPNSHDERTIAACGEASATARSPTSLERP